ncbi:hypothetical protein BDW69DRAFT_158487 [Aspergillus filifer]
MWICDRLSRRPTTAVILPHGACMASTTSSQTLPCCETLEMVWFVRRAAHSRYSNIDCQPTFNVARPDSFSMITSLHLSLTASLASILAFAPGACTVAPRRSGR